RPKPAMFEHRQLAAPMRFSGAAHDAAAGRITVTNHQDWRDLSWLAAEWELTVDGERFGGGQLPLPADLGPSQSATVAIPGWAAPPAGSSGHSLLTIVARTAADEPWAPAGHELGWGQVEIQPAPHGLPGANLSDEPAPVDEEGRITSSW